MVTRPARVAVACAAVAVAALGACTAATEPGPTGPAPSPTGSPTGSSATRALRDLAPDGVLVGTAAAGGGHHAATGDVDPLGDDPAYRALVATQFSSLTPENQMKWAAVHPERDRYDFAAADEVVDFARAHGQSVRGHNLLWQQANPAWLTAGTFSDDELRQILHDHVATVVGHFKGKVAAWDVANEVLDDSGDLRTTDNPFLRQLGVEAIADAFRWAHQADPDAVLYLNDFNVESDAAKRDAYLKLVRDLQQQDVPVGGFGLQGHLALSSPFPDRLEDTLRDFADLGLDVAVTELDVRIPLGADGVPTHDQLVEQADYYRRAVRACLDVSACRSITVWGVPDGNSWVPTTFPDQGAATPFADDTTPKPAFTAMADALAAGRS